LKRYEDRLTGMPAPESLFIAGGFGMTPEPFTAR